jgi:hypothetical protein
MQVARGVAKPSLRGAIQLIRLLSSAPGISCCTSVLIGCYAKQERQTDSKEKLGNRALCDKAKLGLVLD